VYSSLNIYDQQLTIKARTVDSPNAAYQRMAIFWPLIEDLLEGSYKIKQEHRKYLFPEPRESTESYDSRLNRSAVVPYFQRIEKMLAGMLTRKSVRLDDVSDLVTTQLFDVDLEGNDLNVWLYNTARIAIAFGHVGVLVDAPRDAEKARPYWVTYKPSDILGWRTEIIDGTRELTQVRLLENVVEPDGKYGEKTITQIRVLERGRYELHRRDEKKSEFKLYEEGETSLKDRIPFSVAYSNRTGFFESRSPLYDIAELNLKHYQMNSDLDNILHISAVPNLVVYGYPNADEITTGPNEALSLPPESRMEYVAPSSDSYEAIFRRLDDLKEQINTLSLAAVLGQKLVGESAEAKRIDRSQNDSTLMVLAQQMQDLIDNCLQFHSEYLNEPKAGTCAVNRDFVSARLDPQEITAYLQLFNSGSITHETLLTRLNEGEILGDDFSVEEELENLQNGGLKEVNIPELPNEEPADIEDDEDDEEEDV
tara:strand:- start:13 stop:1455 length:1443 start_codon:yes stop_codon:yes gene_type:complete